MALLLHGLGRRALTGSSSSALLLAHDSETVAQADRTEHIDPHITPTSSTAKSVEATEVATAMRFAPALIQRRKSQHCSQFPAESL